MITTDRLIIDSITTDYSKEMYELASNPSIGYWCGWQPHKSIEDSMNIIKTVLSDKENYGIFLKDSHKLIGGISIKIYPKTNLTNKLDECELGFWIGVPYQRKGYCLEAIKTILNRAFNELNMKVVYCGYYDGNISSKIVQEKAGFKFLKEEKHIYVSLLNEYRDNIVSLIKKEEFNNKIIH